MRILALIAIAGCSSSSGGTVTGSGFDVSDSVSAVITTSDGAGGTASSAQIILASTAGLCSDAGASPPIERKGQRFIRIDLRDNAGAASTAPTAPGSYTVYPNTGSLPPKSSQVNTGGFDATCQPVDADMGSSQTGTVTLTAITSGAFSGSFDVVLNTGDHLTGTFDPESCPALQTAADSTASPQCL